MTYAQITEQRNKLMHDAGVLAQSKNADAETRTKVTAMLEEADGLAQDAENAKRLEAHADETRSVRPPAGEIEGTNDVVKSKLAFRDWMRTGRISPENRAYLKVAETRDLLSAGTVTTSTTGGNVLVPVGFDPQLHTAQRSYGAIVGAVRSFKTDSGNPIRVALADDTANSLTVIGEATAVSELYPSLSGFVSYTDELTTGLVKISNSLLQDSAFSVDQFIQDTFAARYFKGLAKMITLGNSSNIQALTSGTSIQNATGGATTISYQNLLNVYGALDPAYLEQSSWVMSSSTRAKLMGIVSTTNVPVLQSDPSGTPFNSLFGRPIVLSAYAPGMVASAIPISFGDISSYTLRTISGGLQIARLTERYAELNETGFIGYCRAGGYNTSQTASPSIVSLQMSAT